MSYAQLFLTFRIWCRTFKNNRSFYSTHCQRSDVWGFALQWDKGGPDVEFTVFVDAKLILQHRWECSMTALIMHQNKLQNHKLNSTSTSEHIPQKTAILQLRVQRDTSLFVSKNLEYHDMLKNLFNLKIYNI